VGAATRGYAASPADGWFTVREMHNWQSGRALIRAIL
jgi:hypothetical protein